MKGFCSLALAFSPSQSSLDHSDWFSKGWGTLYQQNMHVAPDCSHTFWGIGLYDVDAAYIHPVCPQHINSISFNWVKMMVMIGLLCSNLVWGMLSRSFGGPCQGRVWRAQVNVICPLLSSLKAFILFLKEGKGVTLLLHGVKMVVSQYDLCSICKSPQLS